jgi:hypothetical protein
MSKIKNSANWYLHLLQLPAGGFFEGWRVPPVGAQGGSPPATSPEPPAEGRK